MPLLILLLFILLLFHLILLILSPQAFWERFSTQVPVEIQKQGWLSIGSHEPNSGQIPCLFLRGSSPLQEALEVLFCLPLLMPERGRDAQTLVFFFILLTADHTCLPPGAWLVGASAGGIQLWGQRDVGVEVRWGLTSTSED